MDFEVTPIENSNFEPPIKRSFFALSKGKILVVGLGALLIIVALSFFLGRGSFSESQVDLKIEGPSEIASGELVSYKISYQNNNKTPLTNARLSLFYPSDAVPVRDGNIVDQVSENFDLGSLESGQSGQIFLSAYLVGDRGNIKTAKAVLTFIPANVRSTFKKEQSLAATITSLSVPITLVAPPSVLSGQTLTYLIDYRNQSQNDFSDLRIKVKYPEGFNFISASPPPGASPNLWDIVKLKQGGGSRISIQGTLSGSEREAKTIALILQKKTTTPKGDVYVDFEKTDATSIISSPYLALTPTVNDSANYTAHLGEDLKYTIVFRNNSQVNISGLTLTANLVGSMFDLSTVRSEAFFDSRSSTITWNSSVVPELNLLRPGQHGTVTFSAGLKNTFTGGATGAANSLIKVNLHLETASIPEGLDIDRLSADNQLVTRISSAPTFDQKIMINDTQFGSTGPFPPKVDNQTALTIYWILVNPASDLVPAKVSAVLAPGVKWENKVRVSGGQIQPVYDSRTNTVNWDLGTLPAGTGVTFPKYEGYFQISITPSVNQVGQSPTLLKNVRLDGTDVFTKEKISRTVGDSTTLNVDDSNETGVVQP